MDFNALFVEFQKWDTVTFSQVFSEMRLSLRSKLSLMSTATEFAKFPVIWRREKLMQSRQDLELFQDEPVRPTVIGFEQPSV